MIKEAKTVEEAISSALQELNLSEDQVDISILEQPTKGLFGKLKGKAVVSVEKKPCGEDKAVEFIQNILDKLDITAKASLDLDKENPVINIIAENSSDVIGYRGEVLDALQTLACAIANVGKKEYSKLAVDCENYRAKREETLINLAHKLEAKATEIKREVILEPMNPFERRIIHTALSESQTVTTKSDGKEPNRYVVIVPNEKDEFSRPYNAGRRKPEDKKGGRNFKNDRNKKQGGKKFGGGFSEVKKKTSLSFGTYLGNSLKDK